MPPTMLPTVAMAWPVSCFVVASASPRALFALSCALVSRSASFEEPVIDVSKLFWLSASAPSAVSSELSGVGAVSTLLISDGNCVSEFGPVTPAVSDGDDVGSEVGEIVGAVSAGESCQFQKRVMSTFSAEGQLPSTASPSTPRVGSAIVEVG